MRTFSAEVETYIASVPIKFQEPLRRVVAQMSDELEIEPIISYQIIGWRIYKSYAIYASGWKDHMSIHGGHFLAPLAAKYPQWFKQKGATLWFQAEPGLPIEAIRAVIRARIASMPDELIPEELQHWG